MEKITRNDPKRYQSTQSNENIGLRERMIDQSQQIEVLLAEIAQLRAEKGTVTSESFQEAQKEINRLNKELKASQEKCFQCEAKNIEINNQLELATGKESLSKTRLHEIEAAQREKLARVEDFTEELKTRLEESYDREAQLKLKTQELERRLSDSDRHIRFLSEKYDRAQIEREEAEGKLVSITQNNNQI